VTLENKIKYGIVIGTNDKFIGVLLNIGEYVDMPGHLVKTIIKKPKNVVT